VPLLPTESAPAHDDAVRAERSVRPEVNFAGLDLARLGVDDGGVTSVLAAGATARLTLDPELQSTTQRLMKSYRLPEAAAVVVEVATGKVLVYASHLERGPARDLCAEATAPAASVFKVITGAALVEHAKLSADTRQCYSGGEQRIGERDLTDDPKRDRWCATLTTAMGRSLNTVFARLAQKHLPPQALLATARKFGFGESVPFDVPTQPSALKIPDDTLEYARTAAGFWHSTLSPLHAAWISATIARGGEAIRPYVVSEALDATGRTFYRAEVSPSVRRFVGQEGARTLTTMMESTVREGTCFKAFHDARKRPFLPGISVAGKTGTLTDAQANRYFTWFSGFAPSKPLKLGIPQIAIAALVVNDPNWQVKANVLARDILRAYFASRGVAKVTQPSGLPPLSKRAARKRARDPSRNP
jgi:cell division protein FtsI/penicillin-binding protein 2